MIPWRPDSTAGWYVSAIVIRRLYPQIRGMVGDNEARSIQLVTTTDDSFDPVLNPELFDGVTFRRMAAYAIDLLIVAILVFVAMTVFWVLGILSFGVLSPVLVTVLPFIPLAYHTFFIGGPNAATIGMGLFGIEVRRMDGGRPGYLQAALLTVVFYVSVGVTGWLILLIALFNGRGRTFHDYLCGTVTIRPHLNIDIKTPVP